MDGIIARQFKRLSYLSMSLVLMAGTSLAAPPPDTPGATKGRPAFPQLELAAQTYGEDAISQLGNKLPDVAAYYGMSTAEFATLLRNDSTAWIDRSGRLLYVDDFPEPAEESAVSDPLQSAPFPESETFRLHSRPGAARVIYLDFDGHVTTGSAWNQSSGQSSIVSPAYNIEGDSSTFSPLEHEYIQKMWRQVAEDYAPFDVDVTTEDPGDEAIFRRDSGDLQYGTRVVITENNFYDCSCGGVAYVGVFDRISSSSPQYYQPAWVFNTSLVGAGEAISHEAGHNLGLSHDGGPGTGYYRGHGSGPTGWAPIMGVGYYQDLVQWSKGEYDGATQSQDDLAVIQDNGAPLMPDDHADTSPLASALDVSSDGSVATLSGSGLIRRSEDVDVFSFVSAGGSYSLNVDPAPFSPNLDILASLYDGEGTLLNSSNPAESLPAVLSGTLAAGEYFLFVEGTGKGDPLDTGYTGYGSLGRYTVSGSVPDPGGLVAPVAQAVANYTPDYAPVTVGFDATGSSDGDGTIASWNWQFGDGNSGSGETDIHTYTQPGTYQATLTVIDNDGLQDSDSINIEVYNHSPLAAASADVTSGAAPLPVVFSSAGSSDPDGSTLAYAWDFGDGSTSSDQNPDHTYTGAGTFTANLTVTDNLGATADAAVQVTVSPPPFVDQYTDGEQFVAGTVTGDHTRTHADDANSQVIRERESGGRKNNRYSFLEHIWLVDVQPGNEVSLSLRAQQSSSADNDSMLFSYSVNGGSYQDIVTMSGTAAVIDGFPLPEAASGGQVRIRVIDSNREAGNRVLDTVSVDFLRITSDNEGGAAEPPATSPAIISATPVSTSSVFVQWSYGSSDASGFRIEHSTDALNWVSAGTTPGSQRDFTDTGLFASTDYAFRVIPFNGAGDGAASDVTWARTDDAPAMTLQAHAYKVKGRQRVDLSWTGSDSVHISRADVGHLQTVSGSSYTDNIDIKGGGSYTYQVCDTSSGDCSDFVPVVF